MYFPDLTPYSYDGDAPNPRILNVGWLSVEHDFPRGAPDPDFLAALKRLVHSPVVIHMGSHDCEFCEQPRVFRSPAGLRLVEPLAVASGSGEIRVLGPDGRFFAAPVLIFHYVETHEYAPPDVFVDAVLRRIETRPRSSSPKRSSWSRLVRRLTRHWS